MWRSLRYDNITAHCLGQRGHAAMVSRTRRQPRSSHGSPQMSKPGSEMSPPQHLHANKSQVWGVTRTLGRFRGVQG